MSSERLTNFPQAVFLTVVTLSLLLLPCSGLADDTSKPPLITLEQFCKMERSSVQKRPTVRLHGTVTLINREWKLVIIQADGYAVKAFLENNDADLASGQLVELTGRAEFGNYAKIMMATGASVLGEGTTPEPVSLDETVPFSLGVLYRWSEVEGPIYSAVANENSYFLYVAGKNFGHFVILPRSPDLPPIKEMRNFRLRARGTPAISTEASRPFRIDLFVPTPEHAEFTRLPVPESGIEIRSTSESGYRDMRGDSEAPARFRAVVRSTFGTKLLFISDEAGALFVELADQPDTRQYSVGDVVEIKGRLNRSIQKPYVQDAQARFLGKGYSQPPTPISPGDGHLNAANLVEITGMLVANNPDENWAMLRHGGTYFRVWYQAANEKLIDSADVGSQISVAGGCWFSPSDDSAFDIYSREATVLFNIPAPAVDAGPNDSPGDGPTISDNVESLPTNRAAPPPPFGAFLPFLLLALLFVLIYLMYRRLREQERFQESIHEQLSNLSHIARLNTLAEMVGALAHELNQPLASVSNYAAAAELLSRKEPTDSEKLGSVLTNIGQEAFRAGEIIRRLRHLVRKKTPGSLPIDISEVIAETVELFKTQHVTASGLVQVTMADHLPTVQADSVQIQQVILNLLLNARDATEAQSERTPAIEVKTFSENGMVFVAVSDNGVGIAGSSPEAIFEPYFTTREKGTGLGLAISRTIIETHGGKITAENGSPCGTRITFSLPISKVPANIAG